jgi:hydroxyquinol 1,2-dioxygenase
VPYSSIDTITDQAVARWNTTHNPRLRELITKLIPHVHAYAKEVKLTHAEWLAGLNFLAKVGQWTTDARGENILLSDVMGLSMLTVMLNDHLPKGATPHTVLGPFYVDDSPELEAGGNMAEGVAGEPCFITGQVRNLKGEPIAGATLDMWQADDEGIYEVQLAEKSGPYLRGVYHSGPDGRFLVKTIAPLGYSIPMDGPVGDLIKTTEISHFRPAHIHFIMSAPGYQKIITHLFKRGTEYLENDVVYGVKQELIADFTRHEPGLAPTGETVSTPFWTINYDFVLAPEGATAESGAKQAVPA